LNIISHHRQKELIWPFIKNNNTPLTVGNSILERVEVGLRNKEIAGLGDCLKILGMNTLKLTDLKVGQTGQPGRPLSTYNRATGGTGSTEAEVGKSGRGKKTRT
jgi:hypothetical protein